MAVQVVSPEKKEDEMANMAKGIGLDYLKGMIGDKMAAKSMTSGTSPRDRRVQNLTGDQP